MASRNTLLPGSQDSSGFPRSQALKFNSGAGTGSAPRRAPRAIPPARPPPAYFAAVAHSEEVIPQHLHGAGPGGVDERPSEDVRQGRHPGGAHVSGRAQRGGVRGPRGAHPAEALLLNPHGLLLRPDPHFSGDHLPPAGRAQGLAPCLFYTNGIFLPGVGSRLPWVWSFPPPLRELLIY